jgi:hypothetical protein
MSTPHWGRPLCVGPRQHECSKHPSIYAQVFIVPFQISYQKLRCMYFVLWSSINPSGSLKSSSCLSVIVSVPRRVGLTFSPEQNVFHDYYIYSIIAYDSLMISEMNLSPDQISIDAQFS